MRLISWNANYNRHRRPLDDSASLLASLGGDLLVLSEAGRPRRDSVLDSRCVGDVPCLAIVARQGLHLEPHPENDAAPDLMAGFRVSGSESFDLLAVWPVSRPDEFSYHQVLMAALDHYADLLGSGRAVMIGDFNSSSRVRSQARTHQRFVSGAAGLGLSSLYHHQTGEQHGQESVSTYRHASGSTRDFHLDYCFVSEELLGSSRLRILHDESWMRVSDHYPLVVDLDSAPIP